MSLFFSRCAEKAIPRAILFAFRSFCFLVNCLFFVDLTIPAPINSRSCKDFSFSVLGGDFDSASMEPKDHPPSSPLASLEEGVIFFFFSSSIAVRLEIPFFLGASPSTSILDFDFDRFLLLFFGISVLVNFLAVDFQK